MSQIDCDECGASLDMVGMCVHCELCHDCCRCDDGPTEAQISDAANFCPPEPFTMFDKDTLGRGGIS